MIDADLISRKAAVSRISDLIVLELRCERIPTWNEVYKALNDLPTVDAVPVEKVARLLADTFSSPCNFSPLDEEMYDVCGENCDMDDEKCWARWIKLKMDGERRDDNGTAP